MVDREGNAKVTLLAGTAREVIWLSLPGGPDRRDRGARARAALGHTVRAGNQIDAMAMRSRPTRRLS